MGWVIILQNNLKKTVPVEFDTSTIEVKLIEVTVAIVSSIPFYHIT